MLFPSWVFLGSVGLRPGILTQHDWQIQRLGKIILRHPMHVVLSLPGNGELWLGGEEAACNLNILLKNGIGAVLCLNFWR